MKLFNTIAATVAAIGISCISSNPAKAQQSVEEWTYFLTGQGTLMCALLDFGYVSRDFAENYLTNIFQEQEEIPQLAISQALENLKTSETNKGCPLPGGK